MNKYNDCDYEAQRMEYEQRYMKENGIKDVEHVASPVVAKVSRNKDEVDYWKTSDTIIEVIFELIIGCIEGFFEGLF